MQKIRNPSVYDNSFITNRNNFDKLDKLSHHKKLTSCETITLPNISTNFNSPKKTISESKNKPLCVTL